MKIRVQKPNPEEVKKLGLTSWPVWEKEVSSFSWHYDQEETCYILEGTVKVTPSQGEPVSLRTGDLAVFPQGMDCTWEITSPIRKHYRFGK